MKARQRKKRFLNILINNPVISIACKKTGISRQTYYRWRQEDSEFAQTADDLQIKGVESVNDLAESVLINNIQQENMKAVQFWLSNNHSSYRKPREKQKLHRSNSKTLVDLIKDAVSSKKK
jgi:transposase-like protein